MLRIIKLSGKKVGEELLGHLYQLDAKEMDYPWSLKAWRAGLSREPSKNGAYILFLLQENNEKLAGFCLFERVDESSCHLLKIIVETEYQGRGWGVKLLSESLEQLQEDCWECELEVRAENTRALRLYHRLGFKELRRVRHFYSDGAEGICMIWRQ